MTQARRALGAGGEDAVAAWYVAQGYEIVERNWRCRSGELDLIVRRGRTFVFCEVNISNGHVPDRALARRAAAAWVEFEAPMRPTDIRFDVASVLAGEVSVEEGAF